MSGPTTPEPEDSVWIGGRARLDGPVGLAEYDPSWRQHYERQADRISKALGNRALAIAHVGSTAVPGLAAKPVIDIVLVVTDPDDEGSYVPALESAGFALRIREPGWFRHRVLTIDACVNLHVFPENCEEVERMIAFRDHLRRDADDRALYERTKRKLAASRWRYMQDYADAKAPVIGEIMSRTSMDRSEGLDPGG